MMILLSSRFLKKRKKKGCIQRLATDVKNAKKRTRYDFLFDGRKFRRRQNMIDITMRSYLFFNVRKFRTQCAVTFKWMFTRAFTRAVCSSSETLHFPSSTCIDLLQVIIYAICAAVLNTDSTVSASILALASFCTWFAAASIIYKDSNNQQQQQRNGSVTETKYTNLVISITILSWYNYCSLNQLTFLHKLWGTIKIGFTNKNQFKRMFCLQTEHH